MAKLTPDMVAKLPRTRDDGEARQSTYYFTGQPCKRGHVTYRYTGNSGCVDCVNRFITKSRVSGIPVVFRVRNRDHVFQADPELSTKLGIILLNDESLQHWLVQRALAGENGYGTPTVRYEAGPEPLDPQALAPTDKCFECGFTLAQLLQGGWTCEQLVREGYAEVAKV